MCKNVITANACILSRASPAHNKCQCQRWDSGKDATGNHEFNSLLPAAVAQTDPPPAINPTPEGATSGIPHDSTSEADSNQHDETPQDSPLLPAAVVQTSPPTTSNGEPEQDSADPAPSTKRGLKPQKRRLKAKRGILDLPERTRKETPRSFGQMDERKALIELLVGVNKAG